jgi:hypothetical protein
MNLEISLDRKDDQGERAAIAVKLIGFDNDPR